MLSYYGILLPFLEDEMHLLPNLIRRDGTCIDVGANSGIYSFYLSKIVGSKGVVMAIEPNKDNFQRIRKISNWMGVNNIISINSAVGSKAENVTFEIPSIRKGKVDDTRAHIVPRLEQKLVSNLEQVKVTTLDNLVDIFLRGRKIDFIKIDAEGYEYFVMEGAHKTINANNPVILIEIEEQWQNRYDKTADELVNFLKSQFEYDVFIYKNNHLKKVDFVRKEYNNYFFLKKSKGDYS